MNRKLIKTISSLTCGLALCASIPLIATSCKKEQKVKYLNPNDSENYYDKDGNSLGKSTFESNGKTSGGLFQYEYTDENKSSLKIIGFDLKLIVPGDDSNWSWVKDQGYNGLYFPKEALVVDNGVEKQLPIVEIEPWAFATIEPISPLPEDVRLPEFITNIGFDNDSKITKIREGAFMDSQKITSISFPASVEEIGDYAFWSCDELTSVDFSKCVNLISIGNEPSTTPSTNKPTKDNTFAECVKLTSLDLSACKKLQIIDPYSFSGCTSLQSVNLSGCVGLRLDENVDYNIGTYAFENCTSLRKVDLSGCVNLDTGSIADFTFSGCGLTNIIIPKSSTGHPHPILGFAENVGNAKVLVSGNTETGEYVFTNRTKVIGSLAYGEVDLSNWGKNDGSSFDHYSEIAEDAFKGSSITKIILSNNIKTINEGAFNDCAFLTQIQWNDLPYTSVKDFVDAYTKTDLFTNKPFDRISKFGWIRSYNSATFSSSNLRDAIKELLPAPTEGGQPGENWKVYGEE